MEDGRENRVEIDTRSPFRSVKEAVMLFGERVLVGEVYANKLKEMQDKTKEHHGQVTVVSELEETKQTLQKAREESMHMAQFLSSLQQQLQQTKREIEHLKTLGSLISDARSLDPETEDLKYVENPKDKTDAPMTNRQSVEFQKKKCVSFSNEPPVAHIVVPSTPPPSEAHWFQRHPSVKKKTKKPFMPFIAGFFSKKRGSSEASLP